MTQLDPQDKQAMKMSVSAAASQVGVVSETEWSMLEVRLTQAVMNFQRTPVTPVEREIAQTMGVWGPPTLTVSVLTR